jgi:hypothetical protein
VTRVIELLSSDVPLRRRPIIHSAVRSLHRRGNVLFLLTVLRLPHGQQEQREDVRVRRLINVLGDTQLQVQGTIGIVVYRYAPHMHRVHKKIYIYIKLFVRPTTFTVARLVKSYYYFFFLGENQLWFIYDLPVSGGSVKWLIITTIVQGEVTVDQNIVK